MKISKTNGFFYINDKYIAPKPIAEFKFEYLISPATRPRRALQRPQRVEQRGYMVEQEDIRWSWSKMAPK